MAVAWVMYHNLSPGLKGLFKHGVLGPRRQKATEWLNDLNRAIAYESARRNTRQLCTALAFASGGLFAYLLYRSSASLSPDAGSFSSSDGLHWLIALGMALIAAASLWFRWQYQALEGAPRLEELIIPFLTILQEDLRESEAIQLWLDLGASIRKSKEITNPPEIPKIPNVRETHYFSPWLRLDTRMADDSTLRCEISDRIRRRCFRKKSASGKVKQRIKAKVSMRLRVQLGLPRAAYSPMDSDLVRHSGSLKEANPDAKRRHVVMDRLISGGRPDSGPPLDSVLDVIAAAYRCAGRNVP